MASFLSRDGRGHGLPAVRTLRRSVAHVRSRRLLFSAALTEAPRPLCLPREPAMEMRNTMDRIVSDGPTTSTVADQDRKSTHQTSHPLVQLHVPEHLPPQSLDCSLARRPLGLPRVLLGLYMRLVRKRPSVLVLQRRLPFRQDILPLPVLLVRFLPRGSSVIAPVLDLVASRFELADAGVMRDRRPPARGARRGRLPVDPIQL